MICRLIVNIPVVRKGSECMVKNMYSNCIIVWNLFFSVYILGTFFIDIGVDVVISKNVYDIFLYVVVEEISETLCFVFILLLFSSER